MKRWTLTQESFDVLLGWLHPDREQAGEKYIKICATLVKGFRSHGCAVPEELADETINRVARKLPEIIDTYVGDPEPYFYRVAHYVHLEHLRREPTTTELPENIREPTTTEEEDEEPLYACLEQCMGQLTTHSREIVSEYYQGEKRVKIDARKTLAERLGINLSTLRLRAHRIRAQLKKCVRHCAAERVAS